MVRYTFDPRIEHTLAKGRRHSRTFSVGIEDNTVEYGGRTVARIRGPSEHAHAIRAAAQAYCDRLNGKEDRLTDLARRVVQAARTPPKGWEGDGEPGFWHSAALDAAIEELVAEVES